MYLKSRSSGFTLIELMVVVVLIGVVAGVAIPNFSRLIENNRVVSTTNSAIGLINFARSEAVRRGQLVTVTADGNTMTAIASDGSVIRRTEPASGATTITDATVIFRASGLTTATADVIFTICSGAAEGRRIAVGRGGKSTTTEVSC